MILGRSPSAILARAHRRNRRAFETGIPILVGLLLGAAVSDGDLLRLVFGTAAGAAFVALLFGLNAETRSDVDEAYSELEALSWLQREVPTRVPLRPARGFAASPSFMLELVRLIDEKRPLLVVELGSGVSTVVIASRLDQNARGRVVSLDHDARYAAQTVSELERQGLQGSWDVVTAPLAPVRIDDKTWHWYTLPEGLSDIDMLVIDGPPGTTGPLARYPALPLLFDKLAPGAVVCLDDAARPDERSTVELWMKEHPELQASYYDNATGMSVLELPERRA